jgi:hypothetical protein
MRRPSPANRIEASLGLHFAAAAGGARPPSCFFAVVMLCKGLGVLHVNMRTHLLCWMQMNVNTLTYPMCWMHMCRPSFDRIMQILERAGLPHQPADQQQQQAEGSVGHQASLEAPTDPDQADMPCSGAACSPGEHASRKPSKDIDWSEISYGGSKHNGGWS